MTRLAMPLLAEFSENAQQLGWGLAAVGILLVSMALLMGIRKRRRKSGSKVTARETLERYKAKGEVRDDLQRVMVEVEEMAKRVAAQLDAKTIAVERLMREADEKIARLEALREAPAADAAPTATPAESEPAAPENGTPADALSREVYALADDGMDAPEIARRLDEHVGKVELILALRSA